MDTTGTSVVITGFFSRKDPAMDSQIAELAQQLRSMGASIAATMVQRRGVSRGGVSKMSQPFDSRFLISKGKLGELVSYCNANNIDAVYFANRLEPGQRKALSAALPCPVRDPADVGL